MRGTHRQLGTGRISHTFGVIAVALAITTCIHVQGQTRRKQRPIRTRSLTTRLAATTIQNSDVFQEPIFEPMVFNSVFKGRFAKALKDLGYFDEKENLTKPKGVEASKTWIRWGRPGELSGYYIPIAKRKFLALTSMSPFRDGMTQVTFKWQQVPNEIGLRMGLESDVREGTAFFRFSLETNRYEIVGLQWGAASWKIN